MYSKEVVVNNPTGLHARPANELVKMCKEMTENTIRLVKEDGKSVDPKNIIGILTAGLKMGTKVVIEVEGSNEDAQGEKIYNFITSLTE